MNTYHDFMTYTQVPRFSYPFHCKIYQYVLPSRLTSDAAFEERTTVTTRPPMCGPLSASFPSTAPQSSRSRIPTNPRPSPVPMISGFYASSSVVHEALVQMQLRTILVPTLAALICLANFPVSRRFPLLRRGALSVTHDFGALWILRAFWRAVTLRRARSAVRLLLFVLGGLCSARVGAGAAREEILIEIDALGR